MIALTVSLWLAWTQAPALPELPPQPEIVAREWTSATLEKAWQEAGADCWAEGDELTFVLRSAEADEVRLSGSLSSFALERVGNGDLWTVTLRIEGLARAAFGYDFLRYRAKENLDPGRWADRTFRGNDAPPAAQVAESLRGTIETVEMPPRALPEPRNLSIYRPPGFSPEDENTAVFMADGGGVEIYAKVLEPLLLAGELPPLVLVGVHSAASSENRVREYVGPKDDPHSPEEAHWNDPFYRHLEFFLDEVIPWAEEELGVSVEPDKRLFFGCSNGADFAIELALRFPDLFGHVLAFSNGMSHPAPDWDPALKYPVFRLTAGLWEPGFWTSTKRWSEALTEGGFEHTFREELRGHDFSIWKEEFVRELREALAEASHEGA